MRKTKKKPSNIENKNNVCFQFDSANILNDTIDKILQEDYYHVLGEPFEVQIPRSFSSVKQRTYEKKKLFFINLKREELYQEILYENQQRQIRRTGLQSSKAFYKWRTVNKPLSFQTIQQVLGRRLYNECKMNTCDRHFTIQTIVVNVENNAYVNFMEFQLQIVKLINTRLLEVYDGRILEHFSSKDKQFQENLWQFYSYEITRIWKSFKNYIKQNQVQEKFNNFLENDLQRLFSTCKQSKCPNGSIKKQGFVSRFSLDQTIGNQTVNYQIEQCLNDLNAGNVNNINNAGDTSYAAVNISNIDNASTVNNGDNMKKGCNMDLTVHMNVSSSCDLTTLIPQNYPLTNDYDSQIGQKAQQSYFRKSWKRPQNQCDQNCPCVLYDNVEECPNAKRKIQCQHHQCCNSQIRQNKDIFCWYMQRQKNTEFIRQNEQLFIQKMKSGYGLKEFDSYGMDFYTVRILFYLLPLHRLVHNYFDFEQHIDNQDIKSYIVGSLIPLKVSQTKDLFQAVKSLESDKEYQEYHYQLKVLFKRLKLIKKLIIKNQQSNTPYQSNLCQLKCFYKGLGVLNTERIIPKNKFIGKFIGELLPPWRQQERQFVASKTATFGYKDEKPSEIKFYCINFQSHYDEESEVKFFSIDPQNKGNFTRSLNHSCDPNCEIRVFVSQQSYVLGVYAIKQIKLDQELTFNYMSVTDNYLQFRNSVCLCGSMYCWGNYLQYKEQIHSELDIQFLEKKYPIKERILDLMKCCDYRFAKQINHINERKNQLMKNKVFLGDFLKKNNQIWILQWIQKTFKMIQTQLKYLRQNQDLNNLNSLKNSNNTIKNQQSLNINFNQLLQDRIAALNAKIQKIDHYFYKLNDFSVPITFLSFKDLLNQLQNFLQLYQNDKMLKKQYQANKQLQRMQKVRRELLDICFRYKKKKSPYAYQYFKKAFTFTSLDIHIYPNYTSQPVRIWRQHEKRIKETVSFKGDNLFIQEIFLTWSGEFKRIYQQHQAQLQAQNKASRALFNQTSKILSNASKKVLNQKKVLSNQICSSLQNKSLKSSTQDNVLFKPDFRGNYLKKAIMEALVQYQEELFGLKKPEILKNQQMFRNSNFSQKQVMQSLQLWIMRQKQMNQRKINIKNTQNNLKQNQLNQKSNHFTWQTNDQKDKKNKDINSIYIKKDEENNFIRQVSNQEDNQLVLNNQISQSAEISKQQCQKQTKLILQDKTTDLMAKFNESRLVKQNSSKLINNIKTSDVKASNLNFKGKEKSNAKNKNKNKQTVKYIKKGQQSKSKAKAQQSKQKLKHKVQQSKSKAKAQQSKQKLKHKVQQSKPKPQVEQSKQKSKKKVQQSKLKPKLQESKSKSKQKQQTQNKKQTNGKKNNKKIHLNQQK